MSTSSARAVSQHEDGEGVALVAQPAAHLQAVHAGQPQVEHDEVDSFAQPRVERGGTVLADLDLVSLPAQGARARGSEIDASSSASSTRVMHRW